MEKLTPEQVALNIIPDDGFPGFTGPFADAQRRVIASIQRDLDEEQAKHPIISEILSERRRQQKMWQRDDEHSEESWSAIITHELGQACFHDDKSVKFRQQMIKIAAVAIAAIEAVNSWADE